MTVVIKQRRLTRQPPAGAVRLSREHFGFSAAEIAFVPRFSHMQSVARGQEILAPQSAAAYGATTAGWALISEASNSGVTLASVPNVSRFTGDVSFLWTGVVTGAHSDDYPALIGVYYGSGAGAPFVTSLMCRSGSGSPNNLAFLTNDGTFRAADVNVNLSSFYGQPIALAVSNAAGSATVSYAVCTPTSTQSGTFSLPAASGNPRTSSASDTLAIGTYPGAATRHPNARTAGAVGWSRAFPLEQLVDLVAHPWEVFEGPRVVIPFEAGAPPPPPPPPSLLPKLIQYGAYL